MLMRTFSGKEFDPANPKPDQIDILDIAVALSKIPRFVGHMNGNYSVAQHSLKAAELAEKDLPRLPKEQYYRMQITALLHDAAEAYTSDIPTPVKNLLRPKIDEIESSILKAIFDKYNLKFTDIADNKSFLKGIDNDCYLGEEERRDHLYRTYNPSDVALQFLQKFHSLMDSYLKTKESK